MTLLTKISVPKSVLVVQPSFKPPPQNPKAFELPPVYPIHLTATATLGSNSSGGVNAIALKNPLGQPMEILQIKWSLYQSATNRGDVGGVIACKLDLGKHSLTNGFVPVWSFGRVENLTGEIINGTDTNGTVYTTNEFSWKLPQPLYVPANAVVIPTFQHRGLIEQEIQVRISYSARSIPPGTPEPKKVSIPYAACYVSKSFNVNNAGTDSSSETDLINPFDEPLFLQRLTGRVAQLNLSNTPPTIYDSDETYAGETVSTIQYNVRLIDSFGRPLIRNFVPFRMAFSGVTRTWETDGDVMDPRSYVLAYVRKDVPYQGASGSNIISQAFIGLVGHRYVVGGAP